MIRPHGPLRANNADALTASLLAGLGIAEQPDFFHWDDIAKGRLEILLPDWDLPRIDLHLVAPGGGPRPARVTALMDYLAGRFAGPLWPGDTGGKR
jgi:DNA-binding transcriptional LysR family regulator